jgi:hypothetical protein
MLSRQDRRQVSLLLVIRPVNKDGFSSQSTRPNLRSANRALFSKYFTNNRGLLGIKAPPKTIFRPVRRSPTTLNEDIPPFYQRPVRRPVSV